MINTIALNDFVAAANNDYDGDHINDISMTTNTILLCEYIARWLLPKILPATIAINSNYDNANNNDIMTVTSTENTTIIGITMALWGCHVGNGSAYFSTSPCFYLYSLLTQCTATYLYFLYLDPVKTSMFEHPMGFDSERWIQIICEQLWKKCLEIFLHIVISH